MNGEPRLVEAWERVLNHDVRTNQTFLTKTANLSDALKQKVEDLYANMQAPSGFKGKVDFTATKTIDGQKVSVKYDKEGFPDFTPHSPGKEYVYTSNTLTGAGTDMAAANSWAKAKFGADNVQQVPNSPKVMIKDSNGVFVEHTWHHHQDGKSMFPVPTKIHSVSSGGFPHTGGAVVIKHGLQGFFNSPIFN